MVGGPPLHPLVQGHDAGAADADIVGERQSCALDLANAGLAAKLPNQLGALRKSGGAERMSLRQQPSRWIDHDLAAVAVVAVVDEARGSPFRRQAKSLIGQDLVRGEAVVQL